jgi:hypothetical protein
MTQAFNLSQFANKVNTSGEADLTTAVTNTLPQGNGGTGLTTPGTSGNVLMSDGTDWVSGTIYATRNRIINGAMVIDQRNAGASVTPANSYTLDRWQGVVSQTGKFTVQQNAGSVTPPSGYKNYLGVTSSSAYSVLTGDYFMISQRIEGYNFADLMFGTASAQTFTFSFWVRSSLTGTFGGSFQGAASATLRSYPFSYTISSANTWEQKTITVAGDTFTNTWDSTNEIGLFVNFGLGAGASASGTVGTWASANYANATGATSVVGTSGATWYVTGIQLEQGSTATPFERRLYGMELANCQRYFEVKDYATNTFRLGVVYQNGAGANGYQEFVVTKRANPSISWTSNGGGRFIQASAAGIINTTATLIAQTISTYGASISTTNTYNNGIGWLDQYGTMQISAEL